MKPSLKKCVVCESEDLLHDVRALDHWERSFHDTCVGRDRDPGALIFKETQTTELSAVVCAGCGYVHYFAAAPEVLRFEAKN